MKKKIISIAVVALTAIMFLSSIVFFTKTLNKGSTVEAKGDKVTANPILTGTEDTLTGLDINGTAYQIPSGSTVYKHRIQIVDVSAGEDTTGWFTLYVNLYSSSSEPFTKDTLTSAMFKGLSFFGRDMAGKIKFGIIQAYAGTGLGTSGTDGAISYYGLNGTATTFEFYNQGVWIRSISDTVTEI